MEMPEMKSTATEMKKAFDELSRLDAAKERIREPGGSTQKLHNMRGKEKKEEEVGCPRAATQYQEPNTYAIGFQMEKRDSLGHKEYLKR